MNYFSTFLAAELADHRQDEMAARMGVTPPQLYRLTRGGGCEPATLAKVVAGISDEPRTRAECMAAYLRDVAELAGEDARLIAISVR